MDLIMSKTMKVTNLALNGLMERTNAIAANTANVTTEGYQRKEVAFENQLQKMLVEENEKQQLKLANSIEHQKNPVQALRNQDPAQMAFLASDSFQGFEPAVMQDAASPISIDGNNVNLEYEMMDASKTGTKFAALTNLQARMFASLQSVIKGVVS